MRVASLNARLAAFDTGDIDAGRRRRALHAGGEPLEDASRRIVIENRMGRKGKDNGVLLLVVRNDRKIRIEVGRGLEGVLTDALSSQIIRKEIVPHFKANDYPGGIEAGVDGDHGRHAQRVYGRSEGQRRRWCARSG